jgi:hypothetical protein
MSTYAVTQETVDKLSKTHKLQQLRLTDYNTDNALVSSQKWADVGHFNPPIEALYFEKNDTLPLNNTVMHRNGSFRRGIYYVVLTPQNAHNNGIFLTNFL